MLTAGQAAKNIINDTKCVLSMELQERLVEIHEKEQVKLWADCVRACDGMDNKLLLRQMELAKKSTFFR